MPPEHSEGNGIFQGSFQATIHMTQVCKIPRGQQKEKQGLRARCNDVSWLCFHYKNGIYHQQHKTHQLLTQTAQSLLNRKQRGVRREWIQDQSHPDGCVKGGCRCLKLAQQEWRTAARGWILQEQGRRLGKS